MNLIGEIKSLGARQRHQLEKLAKRRIPSREICNTDFARALLKVAFDINRMLAVVVGRNGDIEYLICGTAHRFYLPDLGRFTLSENRLRKLRVIVADPSRDLQKGPSATEGSFLPLEETVISSPEVTNDLITDLQKLRLDCVLVVTEADGGRLPTTMIHLAKSELRTVGGKHKEEVIAYNRFSDLSELQGQLGFLVEYVEESIANSRREFKTKKDGGVLVGVYTGTTRESEDSMEELQELARSAGVNILDTIVQKRNSLDPRTVIGKGKLEDIVLRCLDVGAELVIFDRELSPSQLRSISNSTELKVLDRSMLILDIFAQRAKTREGKLQVELAQLKYSLPRLTERDSGLSRLTGGIGGRGPGETVLEISRRRVRDKIVDVEDRLDEVFKQRELRRSKRSDRGVPVMSLVGYTNVGKSTLMNALTKGDVFVENKMFATLDTTTRRIRFPNEHEAVFVDTVGFIRELPDELVAAFRSTLEEIGESDVVVRVLDATSPQIFRQLEVVEKTLTDLGFNERPSLFVVNKIDGVSDLERSTLFTKLTEEYQIDEEELAFVSALTREGVQSLIPLIQEKLQSVFTGRDPGHFVKVYDGDPS